MNLIITLVATVAAVLLLREPIRKAPWVFYILAIVLDVLLLAGAAGHLPAFWRNLLITTMQKGALGMAMFAVVMWIGVLPRDGKASKWLRPIRAELSIIACILIVGHMATYLGAYLVRLFSGAAIKGQVVAALVVALLLLLLILVLGITSFRFVKRHMSAKNWKKLQTLAYLFYGLVFVHMALMLGYSAIQGGTNAIITLVTYAIVFGGYVIARIWRAVQDKRDQVDLVESVMSQGFEDWVPGKERRRARLRAAPPFPSMAVRAGRWTAGIRGV